MSDATPETAAELATHLADARRQIASLSAANDALTRTYALVNGGVMRERDEALAQLAAAREEIILMETPTLWRPVPATPDAAEPQAGGMPTEDEITALIAHALGTNRDKARAVLAEIAPMIRAMARWRFAMRFGGRAVADTKPAITQLHAGLRGETDAALRDAAAAAASRG